MTRMETGLRVRPDGTFEKRFTVEGKRYSVYDPTKKEIKSKELEIRNQIAAGLYTNNRNITLSQYFVEWEKQREGIEKQSTAVITQTVVIWLRHRSQKQALEIFH